jgi:hypothetical protein
VLASEGHAAPKLPLAANPSLSAEVQHVLALDEDSDVRHVLARSRALHIDVQRVLVRDVSVFVRSALAKNSWLDLEVQLALAVDDQVLVRQALSENDEVVLTEHFPVAFLELSERGRDLVDGALRAAGAEPEDSEVLRQEWVGTLEELVGTTKELGAEEVTRSGCSR